jgi:hypothetical protein
MKGVITAVYDWALFNQNASVEYQAKGVQKIMRIRFANLQIQSPGKQTISTRLEQDMSFFYSIHRENLTSTEDFGYFSALVRN